MTLVSPVNTDIQMPGAAPWTVVRPDPRALASAHAQTLGQVWLVAAAACSSVGSEMLCRLSQHGRPVEPVYMFSWDWPPTPSLHCQ